MMASARLLQRIVALSGTRPMLGGHLVRVRRLAADRKVGVLPHPHCRNILAEPAAAGYSRSLPCQFWPVPAQRAVGVPKQVLGDRREWPLVGNVAVRKAVSVDDYRVRADPHPRQSCYALIQSSVRRCRLRPVVSYSSTPGAAFTPMARSPALIALFSCGTTR
jgi:hypothetical protein